MHTISYGWDAISAIFHLIELQCTVTKNGSTNSWMEKEAYQQRLLQGLLMNMLDLKWLPMDGYNQAQ
ncbi:predicted protein [Lichtheimia corymbifera JMRC:FSU:9682]|uniref:Uncharacterized protein n=1 Tax=Lichtheimia corymbifera JMRC:FSU:9682 TaxID=1263082 RepID=A0A068RYI9_9FUNG|nr:predicted protein [Lichtheimia corymbifera JMRC:FSU:9682]